MGLESTRTWDIVLVFGWVPIFSIGVPKVRGLAFAERLAFYAGSFAICIHALAHDLVICIVHELNGSTVDHIFSDAMVAAKKTSGGLGIGHHNPVRGIVRPDPFPSLRDGCLWACHLEVIHIHH